MDLQTQLIIALGLAFAVGIPILLYMHNRYKKEGKSVKYLEFKVAIVVGIPIVSIPFLLSDNLSILDKVLLVISMLIAGVMYGYTMTSARRTFRKIMGLPPEDEHTGEVIKDNKKKE